MDKLNIIIAEKYPVIRIGLDRLLTTDLGLNVVTTFWTNFTEANTHVKRVRKPPDLLIVGHSFTKVEEIRLWAELLAEKFGYRIPILVFSELNEKLYAPLCFAAGAVGYVHKSAGFAVLSDAIDTVLKGGWFAYGRPIMRIEERQALLSDPTNPFARLSKQEREIYNYLTKRYNCMEISEKLKLHRSTVSTLKRRVYKKLNVVTDLQFEQLWMRYGNGIYPSLDD